MLTACLVTSSGVTIVITVPSALSEGMCYLLVAGTRPRLMHAHLACYSTILALFL